MSEYFAERNFRGFQRFENSNFLLRIAKINSRSKRIFPISKNKFCEIYIHLTENRSIFSLVFIINDSKIGYLII